MERLYRLSCAWCRWWDLQRPHANPSMQSLWETQKFRVKSHPCDRDYQHLHKMQGCAPSFSLNAQQRGLLGFVDTQTSKRIEIGDVNEVKSTVAQTIDRNHFTVVGLGRPSFNTSRGSPYRSTGFMSEQRLFYVDTANNEKSVFKNCKSIDQARRDAFLVCSCLFDTQDSILILVCLCLFDTSTRQKETHFDFDL